MDSLNFYYQKTIVYAVLNWGLGHATRSIPIIHKLLNKENNVIIVSDGQALQLLKNEFLGLKFYETKSYGVKYYTSNIWINMVIGSVPIAQAMIKEHLLLKKIEAHHNPDLIISDSRFGFLNKRIKSIIITHQVHIHSKNAIIGFIATKLNLLLLNRFDHTWIMDDEESSCAGKLSRFSGLRKYVYIGNHSRMNKKAVNEVYDLCIVLSGPENMRTKLEKKLLSIFSSTQQKVCLVRGKDDGAIEFATDQIEIFGLLNSSDLNDKICKSKLIICRSGYSSIMDLVKLDKKAILIATPGQTEQEYLADLHSLGNQFRSIQQSRLSKERIEELGDQLLNCDIV